MRFFRRFASLRAIELAFLVFLVVALLGLNAWNIVTSVLKVQAAKDTPSQKIELVRRSSFDGLTIAGCLSAKDVGEKVQTNEERSFTARPIYARNISDVSTVTIYPLLQLSTNLTAKRLNSIDLLCLEFFYGFPFSADGDEVAALQIRVPNGVNRGVSSFVVGVTWNGASNGGSPTFAIVPINVGYQILFTRREHVDLNGKAIERKVDLEVQPQKPSTNFKTNETGLDLTFSAALQSYDVTVIKDVSTFDGFDCAAAIFAWLSLSAALFRFTFPVLPYGPRSLFFVCGAGPEGARERGGKGADGVRESGRKSGRESVDGSGLETATEVSGSSVSSA